MNKIKKIIIFVNKFKFYLNYLKLLFILSLFLFLPFNLIFTKKYSFNSEGLKKQFFFFFNNLKLIKFNILYKN